MMKAGFKVSVVLILLFSCKTISIPEKVEDDSKDMLGVFYPLTSYVYSDLFDLKTSLSLEQNSYSLSQLDLGYVSDTFSFCLTQDNEKEILISILENKEDISYNLDSLSNYSSNVVCPLDDNTCSIIRFSRLVYTNDRNVIVFGVKGIKTGSHGFESIYTFVKGEGEWGLCSKIKIS